MNIAMVQTASADAEAPAERLARVAGMVREIEGPVDLVVLPELWLVGYAHFDRYSSVAESLNGSTVQTFSRIAAERGCYLHVGSFVETAENEKLRNTAVLLGPEGQIALQYSKVHVFGYQSLEAGLLQPGESVSTVPTPFGSISTTTCYDLRFPGLWTQIVDTGAELVIVPAAWPAKRRGHWRVLTTARALDNQVFVIAVNAVGTHSGVEFGGHSRVIDPWGRTVAEAGDTEGVTIVSIDTAQVRAIRSEFPILGDRLADYAHLGGAASRL